MVVSSENPKRRNVCGRYEIESKKVDGYILKRAHYNTYILNISLLELDFVFYFIYVY
jgi:hypothetical protein